jgi:hypothetical protein
MGHAHGIAFEMTRATLQFGDQSDPNERIAERIIELANTCVSEFRQHL